MDEPISYDEVYKEKKSVGITHQLCARPYVPAILLYLRKKELVAMALIQVSDTEDLYNVLVDLARSVHQCQSSVCFMIRLWFMIRLLSCLQGDYHSEAGQGTFHRPESKSVRGQQTASTQGGKSRPMTYLHDGVGVLDIRRETMRWSCQDCWQELVK